MKRTNLDRSRFACLLIFSLFTLFLFWPAWSPGLFAAIERSAPRITLEPPDLAPPWQPNGIEAAWQRARAAGAYEFSTDLVQRTLPAPSVRNVGRSAEQTRLRIEGETDPAAETMELTLWSQGGSVLDPASGLSVRVEGGRTLARQGNAPWEEIGDVSGLFAPDGDAMAYLAAARHVSEGEPERRGGRAFTRYHFEIDGPRFAAYMRDQLQRQMAGRGKLPYGLEPGISEAYYQMSGRGELWVGEDGLPARQIVSLAFPDQRGNRVEAEITVDFRFPELGAASAGQGDTSGLVGAVAGDVARSVSRQGLVTSTALLALAASFALLLGRYRRSKRLYTSLALGITLSMVLSPLLQARQVYAFSTQQQAEARRQAATEQESEMERTLREMQAGQESRPSGPEALALIEGDDGSDTDGDGLTNVQELFLGTSPVQEHSLDRLRTDAELLREQGVLPALLAADDGTDSDGDGLTDYQEQLLGTNSETTDLDGDGLPDGADTDGDGLSDLEEIEGFDYNGRRWYSDPIRVDSNGDGIDDAREWNRPDTPYDSWDRDGDGTPNTHDDDDDGDGVPDRLDLSPFQKSAATFGEAEPFELTIDGLTPEKPVSLEFQLRPRNPEQLRYAFNVLDWPYDSAGQVQDVDGKTFYDVDPSTDPSPNANGDLKLIPMLEVRIPDAPSGLPLRGAPPVVSLDLEDQTGSGLQRPVTITQESGRLSLSFGAGSFPDGQPVYNKFVSVFEGSCANLGRRAYNGTINSQGFARFYGLGLGSVTDGGHAVVLYNPGLVPPNPGSQYACASIPFLPREGDRWIDTDLLGRYQIFVRSLGGERKVVYVPLQLTTDEKEGSEVAFSGKMIYRPGAGSWGPAQEVRLVWLVQGLIDTGCRSTGPGQVTCDEYNAPQVIQTYYTDWILTGLNVREDHGAEVAIIYEDPALDPNLNSDDELILLSHGLEQSFLAGRDCDRPSETGLCVGDGELDVTVREIGRRFNHATNGAVEASERWNIPNTLAVVTATYEHVDAAYADVTSNRTPAILAGFTPHWSAGAPISPTLMFAREERFRAMNLDAGLDSGATAVAWQGNRLALDLGDAAPLTMAGLSWTPYKYENGAWKTYPIADYWDELGRRYANAFDDELATGESREVVGGKLVFFRLYYMALANGASSLVRLGDVPLSSPGAQADVPLGAKLAKVAGRGVKFVANTVFVLAGRGINPKATFEYLNAFVEQSGFGFFAPQKWANLKGGLLRGAIVAGVLLAVVTLAVFGIAHLTGQEWGSKGLAVAITAIQVAITLGMPLKSIIKTTHSLATGATKAAKLLSGGKAFFTVLTSSTEILKSSFGAALLGLIFDIGVTWGLFFYQWASGAFQSGTVEFETALATTIAATFLAILFFAISLTVVGTLLVALSGAVDAILGLLCNTFSVKSACFTISGTLTRLIASAIHGVQPIFDLSRDDLIEVQDLQLVLGEHERGYVEGNTISVRATVRTNLYQALLGSPQDQARLVYHAGTFLSADKLRSTTFRYALGAAAPEATRDAMRSEWKDVSIFDRLIAYVSYPGYQDEVPFALYSGWSSVEVRTPPSELLAATNLALPLSLNTSYAIPAASCWGTRAASSCKDLTLSGRNGGSDLGLVVDVFPATLDEFYSLIWDGEFQPQRDHDGDGLIAQRYGGLDPDDTRWDTDGDGLSDGYELELRAQGVALSPTAADTDGDGLSDREEIRLGSDPTRSDGDGDGLSDKQEADGWLFTYSTDPLRQIPVTSDPSNPDSDGDGMSDGLEYQLYQLDPATYPYHPRVANPSPLRLSVESDDADGYVAPGVGLTFTATARNESESSPVRATGALTSAAPAVLGGASTTTAFDLLPGEQVSHTLALNVSTGAATQQATVASDLTARLSPVVSGSTSLGDLTLQQDYAITIDDDAPASAVTSFADGAYFKAGDVATIGGTASDPTSRPDAVDVRVNGAGWERATGAASWAYPLRVPASEGEHTLETRAADAVGNVQAPQAINFIADGTPPTVTSDLAANTIVSATQNTDGRWLIELSGTVSDPSAGDRPGSGARSVEVSLAPYGSGWQTATLTGPGAWAISYTLAAVDEDGILLTNPTGSYTVTVRAEDQVGNLIGDSDALRFPLRVDTTPPDADLEIAPVSSGTVISGTTSVSDTAWTAITQTIAISGTVVEPSSVRAGVESLGIALTPADLGVAPGVWRAWYFNRPDAIGQPAFVRADAEIDFDWGSDSPAPGVAADSFSVAWTRESIFRVAGTYRFSAGHDADGRIQAYLDGELVLDTTSATSGERHVAAGLHTLRVVYAEGSGEAGANFLAELVTADPLATSLADSGSGVVTTTWTYTVPAGIEGLFQIDLHGADVLGNLNTGPNAYNFWRGEIDTAAPRVGLEVDYVGVGNAAQTIYRVWANDFNLVEAGFESPCAVEPGDRSYYASDWWRDWFKGTSRLYQISSTCTVNGHQTAIPPVTACDLYGRCTTVDPDAPQPPNTRALYWVHWLDGGTQQVRRIDLTGGGVSTVVEGDVGARSFDGIAVDVNQGYLYWSDFSSTNPHGYRGAIWRANLDGSDVQLVWQNTYNPATTCCIPRETMDYRPEEIVFDPVMSRIFWAQNQILYRVDADGSNFITATLPFTVSDDLALDPNERILFLTPGEAPLERLYFVDADTFVPTGGWIGDPQTEQQSDNGFFNIDDLVADPLGRQLFLVRNAGEIRRVPYPNDFSAENDGAPTEPFTSTILYNDGEWYVELAIDPPGEKLYFGPDSARNIKRMNLDGTLAEVAVAAGGHFPPEDLALDVNYHPEATAQITTTRQDTPVAFGLDVHDPNLNPLAYTLVEAPGGALEGLPGARTAATPVLTYTPPSGFVGVDRFTYQVDDGRGGVATATVSIQVLPPVVLDSAVLTPADDGIVTSLGPATVQVGAVATEGLKEVTLLVNGSVINSPTWPQTPAVTDTIAALDWTPGAEGVYTLTTVATDWAGGAQAETRSVRVVVDQTAPAVDVEPEVLGALDKLETPALVPFGGTASDTAGIARVEVRVDGGPWAEAVLDGERWRLPWDAGLVPDGRTYNVTARATDRAGRTSETTAPVVVDFQAPAPVTATLAFFESASGTWQPLSPSATLREANARLRIEWGASSDGSGIAGYSVGWTENAIPAIAALSPYGSAATHEQVVGEARSYYAHVGVRDPHGNTRWQTLGPVYVDAPETPDILSPVDYHGWMESGGSQIGADREASHHAGRPVQRFYATWDETNLRLAWTGADWDQDGDLFIYLDTRPGGADTAYNPYGSGETIGLPAQDGRQLAADYLVWATGSQTATLLSWSGSDWQVEAALNGDRFKTGADLGLADDRGRLVTDITLPFGLLGIADPAGAALRLVAFASEEGALRLWAAMPDKNPLNSVLVANPMADQDALGAFTLTQQYEWASLGSGVRPNDDRAAESDLHLTLLGEPGGATVTYLGSSLFDRLSPVASLDADLDGRLDVALPLAEEPAPVGDGQVVTYTVVYENRGVQAADDLRLTATLRGALVFPGGSTSRTLALGDIPAGAVTATLRFTATIDAARDGEAAELQLIARDAAHGAFDWLWAHHEVDSEPPTTPVINSPADYAPPERATVAGEASDRSGLASVELEVTRLPAGAPSTTICSFPASANTVWSCVWESGATEGEYRLRARASDSFGNRSDWSVPVTVIVDTTAPTITLDAASAATLRDEAQRPGTVLLGGEVLDTFEAQAVEMCSLEQIDFDCLRAPANPGDSPRGTWQLGLPIYSQGDGITQTVVFYGLDAAGNRSTAPLTQSYRIDTVAPVLTVTAALTEALLEDYESGAPGSAAPVLSGTVSDGGGVRRLQVRLVAPSGSSRLDDITPDPVPVGGETWSWQYVPRLDEPGTYTLTVEVEDRGGNLTTEGPYTLTAAYSEIAGLAITADSPTEFGDPTTLTATVTSGRNVTYTWDLGDGTGAPGQVVSHTYLSVGAYSVVVTAANGGGSAVATATVTIVDQAIAGMAAANSSPTVLGVATHFTATVASGTNVSYEWDFGDAETGSGRTASHTYTAAGVYTAIVTATNGAGSVSATTVVTVTNDRPLADAGPDQIVPVGEEVTLDGGASHDPDGHLPLAYRWRQTGGPAVALSSTSQSQTTFRAPETAAVLTFTLTVTDAEGAASLPDTVVVTATDEAITGLAAANSSPTVLGGTTFFTATVAGGTNVEYEWDFGDGESGSGDTPSHRFTQAGIYTATVTATNQGGSVAATTLVTITNEPPVADAGPDQTVLVGEPVTLDGSASHDPDGHGLSYTWEQTGGPRVLYSAHNSPQFSFLAPTTPAVMTFTLTVEDAYGLVSDPDTMVVTVTDAAIAGLTAANSSPKVLGGMTYFTATVAGGTNVSYEWDFGDGFGSGSRVASHTYTRAGVYIATVTARNGAGSVSETTVVTITNEPPVADAGPDQVVLVDEQVALDGGASHDPDGHLPLFYLWNQTGGPYVPLFSTSRVTFTAPSEPAVMTFTLTVIDARGLASVPDTVVVTVADEVFLGLEAANSSPTILGETTHFTATVTGGTNVNYEWDFGDGTTTSLGPLSGATPSHRYTQAGLYTATVTVTNRAGSLSATTLVTITNEPPVADAGADQTVLVGEPVTLDGSASHDPDGHGLSYTWEQTGGPKVGLNLSGEQLSFLAPSIPSVLTFSLTVKDAYKLASAPDTVVVTVTDEAIAGLTAANSSPTTAGESTTLTATIASGTNAEITWDFGDGTGGSGSVVTHRYASSGLYTATVTASNSVNAITATTTVTIVDLPITSVTLTANDARVAPGSLVQFAASHSGGTGVSYRMDFGDGSEPVVRSASEGSPFSHSYSTVGIYTVTLTALNSVSSLIDTILIEVETPVQGVRLTAPSNATAGSPVVMTATITGGSQVTYEWSFGDGGTLVTDSPIVTHTYTAAGSYVARVTADNGVGSRQDDSEVIWIQEPISGVTVANDSPTPLDYVTVLSATIQAGSDIISAWDFGDGTGTSGGDLTQFHFYTAPGTYTATFTASNAVSVVTRTTTVRILDEPIRSLSAANDSPTTLGRTTTLTASVSGGTNPIYSWDFGDGRSGSGAVTSHTYGAAGTFTATVTATNTSSVVTATTVVTVVDYDVDEPLEGLRILHSGAAEVGVSTTLTATVERGGGSATYTWEFGRLERAAGQVVSHTFYGSGPQVVTVTARNLVNTLVATTTVTVQSRITYLELSNDGPTELGEPTTFRATANATGVDYEWNLGDGATKHGAQITHTYARAGTYTAILTASNLLSSRVATTTVAVDALISGLRAVHEALMPVGTPVTFTAEVATGTNLTYRWRFSEGSAFTETYGQVVTHTFASAGSHNIRLVASNSLDTAVYDSPIQIVEPIVRPAIHHDPATGRGRQTMFEVTLSAGSDVEYAWDLGDGTTGDFAHVYYHLYQTAGTYTVVVTASNPLGSEVVTSTIRVDEPIQGLSATNDGPSPPGGATLLQASVTAGTNVTYKWNLGDGSTALGPSVSHIYPGLGTHTAVVTATNGAGSQTATTTVVVQEQAIAGLGATNDSPALAGTTVTLSASVASGSNISYTWDLGDGSPAQTGAVVTHSYTEIGVYTATVTATNPVNTMTATTVVSVGGPISGLSAGNDGPTALGTSTTLSATLAAGHNSAKYAWDLGDGTTTTGPTVAHTYASAGRYTATVTATDGVNVLTATTAVLVEEAVGFVTARFASTGDSFGAVLPGQTEQAEVGSDSGTNVSYEWDWGDGTLASGNPVTHTYEAAGEYTVILTASNSVSRRTRAFPVYVEEAIDGLVVAYDGPTPLGMATAFTATVADGGGDISYAWDFGDGLGSEWGDGQQRYTYRSLGSYTVTVTAENHVSSLSATTIVTVTDDPYADLSIVVAARAGPVDPGSPLTYTLTVTNAGPDSVAGLVVSNSLPAGATFVSASGNGWDCSEVGGIVGCEPANPMPEGTASTILIDAIAPADADLLVNQATLSSPLRDPNPADNSAVATTAFHRIADVAIAKTASDLVAPGEQFTYTLTVTNAGPSAARGTQPLSETFANREPITVPTSGPALPYPSELAVEGLSGTVESVQVTLFDLSHTFPGDLRLLLAGPGGKTALLMREAGGSNEIAGVTLTFDDGASRQLPSYTEPITSGSYLPTDHVFGSGGDFPEPAPAGPYTARPLADVFGGIDPNGTWQLYVYDAYSGDGGMLAGGWALTLMVAAPADNVVTDPLPGGVTFESADGDGWSCAEEGGLVTCRRVDLPVGTSEIAVVVTAPNQPGTLTNTASIAPPATDPDLNSNSDSVTIAVAIAADLQVRLGGPESATPGTAVIYTVTATNAGPHTATGVPLRVDLPVELSGTTWSCTASGGATCPASGSGEINTPVDLPAGGQAIFVVRGVVASDAAADQVRVSAQITPPAGAIDSNEQNNRASLETPLTASADVVLSAAITPAPALAGVTLTATLQITNQGPSAAVPMTVSAGLPPEMGLPEADGNGWNCTASIGNVECTAASLADGATAEISIVARAPATGGAYEITATASAGAADPDPSNNRANAAVTAIEPVAALVATNDSPTLLGAPTGFTATVSSGTNVTYTWDFGDGNSGEGATISHTFGAASDYTATVTATNGLSVLTATTPVRVETPIEDLTLSLSGATALGATTWFTATATGGRHVRYEWDFGDGTRGGKTNRVGEGTALTDPAAVDGAEPTETFAISHTYEAVGRYTARFTATNGVSTRTTQRMVVVEEAPAGLAATNDGPTRLGAPTGFTATLERGTDVSFTWAFGDGAAGDGAEPSHTYTAPGHYTAVVTATNRVGVMTATTTVEVVARPEETRYRLYLPLLRRAGESALPDWVVERIVVTEQTLSVVIRNGGRAAAADPFWVDLYVDPDPAPTRVNETWELLAEQGLVWGVEGTILPLEPGATITLSLGDEYFRPTLSRVAGPLPAGTRLYAQVDSAHTGTDYGAVPEAHEASGAAYNNVTGPVVLAEELPLPVVGTSGDGRPQTADGRPPLGARDDGRPARE